MGREKTKKCESLRLTPYQDSKNIWTVGYGHNCQTGSINPKIANLLFEHDFNLALHSIQNHCYFFDQLDEIRKYVLVDMTFNMGINKILQFTKMLSALQIKDYNAAAQEILHSEYAKQVKQRAIDNAEMIRTGEFRI